MAEIDDTEAHNLLIQSAIGVDLAKQTNPNRNDFDQANSNQGQTSNLKNENDPQNDSTGFSDILSRLAKSNTHKIKSSQKQSKDFKPKNAGPAQDRLERNAKYENTVEKDLDKWELINRQSERQSGTVNFPLTSHNSKFLAGEKEKAKNNSFNFAPSAHYGLEMELQELFNNSRKVTETDKKTGLTELEKKLTEHLASKEVKERINNLRKNRFLISSQEAKNKRVRKIKSKNYRRRQRKILEKEEEKALLLAEEAAKKGDVEQLKILQEEKDRMRALERASLKHKHTSSKVKGQGF